MTEEDIIRMAQEAGWKDLRNYDSEMNEFLVMGGFKDLERFAALVASAERERLTDAAMKAAKKAVDVAIALEREACAIVCDDINAKYKWPQDTAERVASQWCADAIRSRG